MEPVQAPVVRAPITSPVLIRPIGPPAPVTVTPVTPPVNPALQVTLTTDQASYTSGQTVNMTFTETNTSNGTVSVEVGPSIDGFTVTKGGQTVWMSNSGTQPDYIQIENLAPGQSLTLTASWTAISATGTYTVYNQLNPSVTASFGVTASS